MARAVDDPPDLVRAGALLAGAGVAGYLGLRWLRGARPAAAATAAAVAPGSSLERAPTAPPRAVPARLAAAAPAAPAAPEPAPPRPAAPAASAAGPVTSPDQLAHAGPDHVPTAPAPRGELPRHFDPVFERHRGELPVEYLRALAVRESNMNPGERTGPAWGLLQVIEVVRLDFNKAHGARVTRAQLLDPETNVRVACWLLNAICASYRHNHPEVLNLRPDWRNPRFVELLTFGWNAGWSEAGGVGRVARYLTERGARDLDLDLVHAHARAAGASRHLSNGAKVRWSRGVAALYLRERARTPGTTADPTADPTARPVA